MCRFILSRREEEEFADPSGGHELRIPITRLWSLQAEGYPRVITPAM
jgi:hypothetical protein